MNKKYKIIFVLLGILCMTLIGCSSTNKSNAEKNSQKDNKKIIKEKEQVVTKDKILEIKRVNFKQYFNSLDGCAVIYDVKSKEYDMYKEEECKKAVTPCSTFKIVSTLIGLHNKVITSEKSKMGYNGVKYAIESWNDDITLIEAFQNSCVWYFKKVIDKVGEEKTKKEVELIKYGNYNVSEWDGSNCNPLPELNGFWLESSLKISPLEQVDILRNIFEGRTIYTKKEIEILKNVMFVDSFEFGKVYGKTGTGTKSGAWFVGFVEQDKIEKYFAVFIKDEKGKEVTGSIAKDIALAILKNK